jgi:drug/metabolite transporter (DMT)-like permease
MNQSPNIRLGVGLALGTALISGLAVYLNSFGVRAVPDAAVYTTAKNAVAALILVGLAIALPGRAALPPLGSRRTAGLVAIAIIGGSVPFVLFFSGLAIATAPTAAFIHKTLFIWVALLAVPFLGERLGLLPVVALAVLLAGQALIAPPTGMGVGPGELMIATATALWSVEVIVAKRLLAEIPVRTLAVARMGLGVVFLIGYLAVSGRLPGLAAISSEGWLWVAVTGVLLAGYVGTWYSALRHAPASVVTSVLVVAAVITGVLSALSRGAAPDPVIVGGYLLVVGGAGVLVLSALGALPTGAGQHRARSTAS